MKLRALALLCALALVATSHAEGDSDPRVSLADVEDEVMCPICGTPLELSNSPQADRERALIRRLIDQGATKSEIKDALVSEYGPEVLAVPADDGFDLTAWILPPAILLLATAAIVVTLRRRRSDSEGSGGGPAQLDPGEARRLESELSAYDT